MKTISPISYVSSFILVKSADFSVELDKLKCQISSIQIQIIQENNFPEIHNMYKTKVPIIH